MNLFQRLWALANVRPQEAPTVRLVLLLAALLGVTRLFAGTAAFALFLDRFDAQRLPWIYIGSSLIVTLVSLLYLRLEQRYSLAQLVSGLVGLILLTLIGYRMGLFVGTAAWLIFSLPIYSGVINALLFTAFWNLLGRIFNLQQGKRLFGLFGAGEEVAVIIAGFALPVLVTQIGTANLLWCALMSGIGALVVLWAVIRQTPALQVPSNDHETAAEVPTATPLKRNWLADPYILLIFAMYICFGLGDYFVDNIFYAQVEGQLTNPEHLAGFLGIFASVVSTLSLGSHLLLSGYMFRRYGVRIVILLTPFLFFILDSFFVGSGALGGSSHLLFWAAVALNLTGQVTDAFDNPAANLLYQPLPATVRMRTQTIIDGMLYPISGGAAGVLLLILTNGLHFDSLQLGYVLLPILILWLLATIALGRIYPRQVQQALRQRLVHGHGGFTPDRDSLAALHQHLRSAHPGVVLYAFDLLAAHDRESLQTVLPALLTHPAVAVRLAAIAQIEAGGTTTLAPQLEQIAQSDPEDAIRSAALRAVATLGGLADNEHLHEFLTADNRPARQGVMIGLLRSGELEGILAAGAQLTQLVHSPDIGERTFVAQILGESGLTSFYRPLLQLLHDHEPGVRRAALAAAGKLQHPKLWPPVVTALADPATRSAAQTALVAGGDRTLAALAAGWAAAAPDPTLRRTLARTCGRLRSPGSAALLLTAIDDPDLGARTQILAALQQCNYQATSAERPRFIAALREELAFAAWTLAGLADLEGEAALALVHDALAVSLHQQQVRLFDWLSLLYDPTVIQQVRRVLAPPMTAASVDPEQRAYAFEALDLLLSGAYKVQLLALYDEQPLAAKRAILTALFPQPQLVPGEWLQAIIAGPAQWISTWLRAAALYKAPAVAATAPPPLVTALSAAIDAILPLADSLIRESAQWAAIQLLAHQPVATPAVAARAAITDD